MTSEEVRAIVESELAGDWFLSNAHGVDLKSCLIRPRKVLCRNTFPRLEQGNPLSLWIVLEETPDHRDGYLIVFDDERSKFGLADWNGDTPVFLGFYGRFVDALQGM